MIWRSATKEKKIICYGRKYKDFPIYLSFVLNNMGYSVLVNDRSVHQDMADVVSCNAFSEHIRTYRCVDFNFSEDVLTGYDYVICYYDEWSEALFDTDSNYIVLNVQIYRCDMELCRRIMENARADIIIVIRDKAGTVAGRKYIGKYMSNITELLDIHEIKLDRYDKEYQYRMDYEGILSLRNMSEDYVKALQRTVCSITGKGHNAVKKALKHMKEGRMLE